MTIAFLFLAHSSAMAGVAECALKSTTTSPSRDDGGQIVALVNLPDDLQYRENFSRTKPAPGPCGLSSR